MPQPKEEEQSNEGLKKYFPVLKAPKLKTKV